MKMNYLTVIAGILIGGNVFLALTPPLNHASLINAACAGLLAGVFIMKNMQK
jgi:hypothetical protein